MSDSNSPWANPSLDFQYWEDSGMPFATARVIDTLWSCRLIPWAGLEGKEERVWSDVWNDAQEINSLESIRQWAARTRQRVWGNSKPVSEQQEDWAYGAGPRLWARARRILGPRLANWLADDEWALDAERWYLNPLTEGWSYLAHARSLRKKDRNISRGDGSPTETSIREQAVRLCSRFGLRRFSCGGDMSYHELRVSLGRAEDGLSGFATAMGWADEDVGAGHISLAFELEPEESMAACLDPLTSTISLGRQEGWGSFAHEWAHALDLVLGAHWSAGRSGYPRYGSTIAEDSSIHIADEHRVMRSFIQRRDHDATSSVFDLHHRLISSIPEVMGDLSRDVPPLWLHRLDVRLRALDNWVDAAQRGGSNPERLRQQWAQWCMGNHIAWSDPDGPSVRPWRARWERLETIAGNLAFGPSPQRRLWAIWAAGKDAYARNAGSSPAYHDTPHERFARSFHAYLRATLGQDTWAACSAHRPDQYPVGADVEHGQRWWPKVLREIKPLWLERGRLLTERTEPSDIAARTLPSRVIHRR